MMQRNTPTDNAEEAKRELLATLGAARELDPIMDESLADRYIEQLRAARPNSPFDQAAARADLLSTLKSARGSDAAGDDALASDYLARLRPPQPATPPAPVMAPPYGPYGPYGAPAPYGPPGAPAATIHPAIMMIPVVLITAAYVVSLIATQGQTWWLFWLIPASLGWFGGGRYRARSMRRYYRDQSRAYRYGRTLPPDEVYRPLPPQQQPPEVL